MGFLGFSFGKKRKSSRKSSKKSKCKKPPARLLKICRKYHVKATKKVGKKRVYKSIASLKKLCLRKARAMKKKLMKMKKKSKTSRRSGFGARRLPMFGRARPPPRRSHDMMSFGKRAGGRRAGKVSRAAAMKAFRSFYKRHCAGRRSGFGNGGNPPLSQSMGYEFCPNGQGGVLGFNSTGLFPSPCVSASGSRMMGSMPVGSMPVGSRPMSTSVFGRRRRRRSTAAAFGRRRRRTAAGRPKARRSMAMEFGRRRRRSTAAAFGRRRRRTAVGGPKRRKRRCTAAGRPKARRSMAMEFGRRRRRA